METHPQPYRTMDKIINKVLIIDQSIVVVYWETY